MAKIMRRKIITAGITLWVMLALSGCGRQTQKPKSEDILEAYKQEVSAKELKQAESMQLAAIQAQDREAELLTKINELTEKLKSLQAECDEYKKKMSQPESWEEKYNKSQAENEELRKLVQYERGLRDEMLKRIKKDQLIIKELKEGLSSDGSEKPTDNQEIK